MIRDCRDATGAFRHVVARSHEALCRARAFGLPPGGLLIFKLALFIGAHQVPEQVTRDDWALLARALGVPPKPLLERLRQLATDLPVPAAATRERFAAEHGDSHPLEYFEQSIRDRCKWTLGSVFGKG